jgi:1-pyrroline-5-carboxylate dehydrogenase
MSNGIFSVPQPPNEPIKPYEPGSPERDGLKQKLAELQSDQIEVPLIIGGEEVKTGKLGEMRVPHNHDLKLGVYHKAGKKEVQRAIKTALSAQRNWSEMAWEHRASIFQKAADLLSGPWRSTLNGATMLGQSKTVHQAEIDAACELTDFWRFNTHYMQEIMTEQPYSPPGFWNRCEYRPLEGVVFAVTPFNFTSIAGNLPTAPAMVGNVIVWKPASSAVYSAYHVMRLLEEAGIPPGVINFIPGSGGEVGDPALSSSDLAGIHFTGSTEVFQHMWKTVGKGISRMKCYPRIVGETGGKNFIFVHHSAKIEPLVVATIRGAFEYQGQKCSAASRMYMPASLWPRFKDRYVAEVAQIEVGPPEDFRNFMAAVINKEAFDRIKSYIDEASKSNEAEIITGGNGDESIGYFIEPTTILTTNPQFKTMKEEIFGPVLTIYVYEDDRLDEMIRLCDQTSPYGLTGAIWGQDREQLVKMSNRFRHSAGNFYINDKPTAAVVGQQPFGGGRASGTNDKAGSKWNILRWMSVRSIKETMVPPEKWKYLSMDEE